MYLGARLCLRQVLEAADRLVMRKSKKKYYHYLKLEDVSLHLYLSAVVNVFDYQCLIEILLNS